MKKEWGAMAARVLSLAAPFLVVSLWLGMTVSSFGLSAALQGCLAGLAVAVSVMLASRCLGRYGLPATVAVYLLALVLLLADAVSWYMQGSSFNERFFVHADVENLPVALQAYPWAIIGAVLGLVLIAIGARWIIHRAAFDRLRWIMLIPALGALLLALMVDAPPHRLYSYFAHARHSSDLVDSDYGQRIRKMINDDPTRPQNVSARAGRNLVFVYLESVERTYADTARFPGLTPNINRLRKQGLDFSRFETFPGVTYTIAGLFSSQCGAPYLINTIFGDDFGKLGFVPNNDNTTTGSFHPELACLGDVLHAAGYDQTFLSGVNLSFANKNVFFDMHHFDHTLGLPQIQALHGGTLPAEGWGLFDSALYDEALDQYRHKEASGKPFSIMLSTVDTHPPQGYLLPDCTAYQAISNGMLDAVHCADHILGKFVEKLSREPGWRNTVVVVMSDHISMRNVASRLYPPDDQRQPLLFILNAGQGDRSAKMYHMDIAPTVLALLGVKSNVRFMAGSDRSEKGAPDARLPADQVAKAVLRKTLWSGRKPPQLCADNSLVAWDGKGSLQIGGWKLPLMLGGFPISHLSDSKTLLVFLNKRSAQLQVLARGQQETWLARARAQSGRVLQITPFLDEKGRHALALDWFGAGGAWASLGSVSKVQDLHLTSPKCAASMHALDLAPAGKYHDLSSVFGTAEVPSAREPRAGYVISRYVPKAASAAVVNAFMFARINRVEARNGTVHINRENRISVVPAHLHPATVEFNVTGLSSFTMQPRIDNLMGSCKTRKDTGVVGLRLSLDGLPLMPRSIVDRASSNGIEVSVDGGHLLRVDVDEGNGMVDCDYFALGFADVVSVSTSATSKTSMANATD